LARALTKAESEAPVALPAYSCFDLVSAAVGADAPVVFYDLDPMTLSPDPASLRTALAAGPFAVVGSNLYGFPVDWNLLRGAAAQAGAVLIEDAAQGLGSRWKEEQGGTFGELTVLSFGRGKGWTGGGGGALLGRGRFAAAAKDAAAELRGVSPGAGLVSAGTSTAQWGLGRPGLYAVPRSIPGLRLGETVYHPPSPPAPASLFSRSLAWGTRSMALTEIETRRTNAEKLLDSLGTVMASSDPERGPALPAPVGGGTSSYLRFPVLLPTESAALLEDRRATRAGIAPGYPLSLPDLGRARTKGSHEPSDFPGADALASRLVTLPTHGMVTRRDVAESVLVLSEFVAQNA
jgi:dTDP-4-amino-4,6-dideoxygalactose transaminase